MQSQSIQSELRDFLQYASDRITSGGERLSIEELLKQWRQSSEFDQSVEDVRQGVIDAGQGKAVPISVAFSDVRKKLGIAD